MAQYLSNHNRIDRKNNFIGIDLVESTFNQTQKPRFSMQKVIVRTQSRDEVKFRSLRKQSDAF